MSARESGQLVMNHWAGMTESAECSLPARKVIGSIPGRVKPTGFKIDTQPVVPVWLPSMLLGLKTPNKAMQTRHTHRNTPAFSRCY